MSQIMCWSSQFSRHSGRWLDRCTLCPSTLPWSPARIECGFISLLQFTRLMNIRMYVPIAGCDYSNAWSAVSSPYPHCMLSVQKRRRSSSSSNIIPKPRLTNRHSCLPVTLAAAVHGDPAQCIPCPPLPPPFTHLQPMTFSTTHLRTTVTKWPMTMQSRRPVDSRLSHHQEVDCDSQRCATREHRPSNSSPHSVL
jgi:hypothetical protein